MTKKPETPLPEEQPEDTTQAAFDAAARQTFADIIASMQDITNRPSFEVAFIMAETSQNMETALQVLNELTSLVRRGTPLSSDEVYAIWVQVFEACNAFPIFMGALLEYKRQVFNSRSSQSGLVGRN